MIPWRGKYIYIYLITVVKQHESRERNSITRNTLHLLPCIFPSQIIAQTPCSAPASGPASRAHRHVRASSPSSVAAAARSTAPRPPPDGMPHHRQTHPPPCGRLTASLCPEWAAERGWLRDSPLSVPGALRSISTTAPMRSPTNRSSMTEEREHVPSVMVCTHIYPSSTCFLQFSPNFIPSSNRLIKRILNCLSLDCEFYLKWKPRIQNNNDLHMQSLSIPSLSHLTLLKLNKSFLLLLFMPCFTKRKKI